MLALLLAVLQPLACHALQADWIQGRDLAKALAVFAGLPDDLKLSPAPYPGQQRTFRAAELKRIATANHIESDVDQDVCFAWELALPDRSQIQTAMSKSLAGRQSKIRLVESGFQLSPKGEMSFPLSGLTIGSDKPALWRGAVRYAGSRQFPIWARVLVTVEEQHLVTLNNFAYGDTIAPGQLRVTAYDGPLRRETFLTDPAAALGCLLKRAVTSGTALTADMLEAPREVTQGETVNAIVENGSARLQVQAVAEANGRKGQIISVRNPRSGRSFHGRVEEKGTVIVVPGGPFGLVVETKKS